MILLWALLTQALAQVESSENFIKEIESRFTTSVDPKKEVRDSIPRYRYLGVIDRDQIIQSEIVFKALRRLGNIQRLEDQKAFAITKKMIVRVYEKKDENDFFYILDNKNRVSYRVQAKYVEDLKQVSEMDEPPRQYTEVTVRKNISPYDKNLSWLNELSGGLSVTNARWVGDLVNDTGVQNGAGFMLKAQSLADMGERFRLGPSLTLENSRHSSTRNQVNMQNLSVGLIGKTKPIESHNFLWRLSAEVRYSLYGQLRQTSGQSQNSIRFQTTSLNLGWERLENNAIGPWSWGINFQRDFPKLVNQKQLFSRNTNETNDSLILQFTQGVHW